MNIEKYISSGILESYVAGTTTQQEQQEVECMSGIYPEIKQELFSLQSGIEAMVDEKAVSPPEDSKKSVLDAIKEVEQIIPGEEAEHQTKDIKGEKNLSDRNSRNRTTTTAANWRTAAIILGLLAFGFIAYFYAQQTEYEERLATLENRNDKLENQIESGREQILQQNAYLSLIQDESVRKIVLGSTDKSLERNATVYWNADNKNVWVSTDKLAEPSAGKQYQLWALQDGKPISLGVIEKDDDLMHKMEAIGEADAFAITLEPLGGKESPTMEQLKVLGKT